MVGQREHYTTEERQWHSLIFRWLLREKGKEDGNCYLGFRVWGEVCPGVFRVYRVFKGQVFRV